MADFSDSSSPLVDNALRPSSSQIYNTSRTGLPGTSDDILLRLLSATVEIRDHLIGEKAKEDSRSPIPHISEKHPDGVLPVTCHQVDDSANTRSVTYRYNNGPILHPRPRFLSSHQRPEELPSSEQISFYKELCRKHKLKNEKIRKELHCFAAYLDMLGGHWEIIKNVNRIVDSILDPILSLEKVLSGGNMEEMYEMRDLFTGLASTVIYFRAALDLKYEGKFVEVNRWADCVLNNYIHAIVREEEYAECLEYIHCYFFPALEMAMDDVCEELAIFEEESTCNWLATQKFEDLESRCNEIIRDVFSLSIPSELADAWSESEKIVQWRRMWGKRKIWWDKMREEMGHLIAHYEVVGGDAEVIKAAKSVQKRLYEPIENLQSLLESPQDRLWFELITVKNALENLWVSVVVFERSLYHQRHAFYFREVKKWMDYLWTGLCRIRGFIRRDKLAACLHYICDDLFSELEQTMVSTDRLPARIEMPGGAVIQKIPSAGNVADELRIFGERSLPTFLANEMERIRTEKVNDMERDTTRFVNTTTVATFFSSVTATTLQFTFNKLDDESSESLRGVVNLFWFLSLVFSVSSGMNSLLGLTWRKSSVYDTRTPPKLIRLWLEKSPVFFLIIAAVAFVIGLNLFAYLSVQPTYVSLATNVFTGLHGACLLGVTAWFIYQLKYDSSWAKRIGQVMERIRSSRIWAWTVATFSCMWTWIRHPKREYKVKKLHLQRNVFWAFGVDWRVARINDAIDWSRDWPGPYILSRFIRSIIYPFKKRWSRASKTIPSFFCFVWRRICTLFQTRYPDMNADAEVGSSGSNDGDDKSVNHTPDEVEKGAIKKAEDAYRASVQEVFLEEDLVQNIMDKIEVWQWGSYWESIKEQEVTFLLWGYPNLVRKFFDDVRPLLVEARENAQNRKAFRGAVHVPRVHSGGIGDGVDTVGPDKQSHTPKHCPEGPTEVGSTSPTSGSSTGLGHWEGIATPAVSGLTSDARLGSVLEVEEDTEDCPRRAAENSGEIV